MSNFEGKVALVTGAASGMGKAVAVRLAERGAKVVLADLKLDAVERVAQELRARDLRAVGAHLQVADAGSCQRAVNAAVAEFGGLNLAVNNAGVPTPFNKVADVDAGEWQRQIGINLTGVFNCLQAEIPALKDSGGGAIVNLASIAGVKGIQGRAAYVAAKHGVVGLTRTCALDYATDNIRINAIAPGYVKTPLLDGRSDEEMARLAALHPMGRMSTESEQAAAILFLLSDEATFMTGAVLMSDGGITAA
ncbi:SDR family NAD(P)-dependent oxidoreductase [Paraburkholderia tropica]|uniref:SDR family NAD(P)-dependent oxidoreductase n=1 Tax=Paraburkholderia tropica TaxID=92647 RepID=UPI002AB7EFDA|nr:SDR family NAD(P)-dependent oxidoreductase [Paraburkholderia tropica]